MVVDFLKNKNDSMSLITFSTTSPTLDPSYPTLDQKVHETTNEEHLLTGEVITTLDGPDN